MLRFISSLLFCFSISCAAFGQDAGQHAKPRNIIVVLANGMGMGQIQAAVMQKGAPLSFAQFPVTGFTQPWPTNGKQPSDSSIAVATGTGMVSVAGKGPETTTLFDQAKAKKIMTALIVTGPVTEPTAKTYVLGNAAAKKDNEALAMDYVNCGLNIIIGGGSKYFTKRYDGRNLYKDFKDKGYRIINRQSSLGVTGTPKTIALVEKDGIYRASDRKGFLTKSVLFALRSLTQADGYFIVVDDTKIEEADSLNNTKLLTEELLDLDKMITALDQQTGGETLVVVIGGFECGGLEIKDGTVSKKSGPDVLWQAKKPTAALVPVFAKGPGSDLFSGMYTPADLYAKIGSLLAKRR